MSKYISSKPIRFITSAIMILIFLIALLAFGVACYGWVMGISYAQAWSNLLNAIRALDKSNTQAVVQLIAAYV